MKRRIVIWAIAGFFVACLWTLYSSESPMALAPRAVWILANVTAPFTLFVHYFKFYFYWALLANAATYALVGLMVETLRLQFSSAK